MSLLNNLMSQYTINGEFTSSSWQNVTLPSNWTVSVWVKNTYATNSREWANLYQQVSPPAYVLDAHFGQLGVGNYTGNTPAADRLTYAASAGLRDSGASWHHVCCVYDGSTTTIYIDGAAVGTVPYTNADVPTTIPVFNGPAGQEFAELTKDFKIFSVAGTALEIQELYSPTNPNIPNITSNLIAKYDLDSDGNDSVGSANLTLNNVNLNATSVGRDCAYLNGTNSEIVFPDAHFWESGDATLSFWINSTDLSGVLYFAHEPEGPNTMAVFSVYLVGGVAHIQWQNSAGQSVSESSNIAINSGAWTLLTFVKSGSQLYFYIDGVLDLTMSNLPSNVNFPGARIGMDHFGWNVLGGAFDDIRIWSRALDASEVSYLHTPFTSPQLFINPSSLSVSEDPSGTYTDTGISATDAEDGDLTGSIVVSGQVVNLSVPGTYTLNYSVTDSHGATATGQRTVTVNPTLLPGGTYTITPVWVSNTSYEMRYNFTGFENLHGFQATIVNGPSASVLNTPPATAPVGNIGMAPHQVLIFDLTGNAISQPNSSGVLFTVGTNSPVSSQDQADITFTNAQASYFNGSSATYLPPTVVVNPAVAFGSDTFSGLGSGEVFTSLMGRPSPPSSAGFYGWPDTNTLHGIQVMLNNGQVWRLQNGFPMNLMQSWDGPLSIPNYSANANQKIAAPGSLHWHNGFWYTHKPSGTGTGTGQQIAWGAADAGSYLNTQWNTKAVANNAVVAFYRDQQADVSLYVSYNEVMERNYVYAHTDTDFDANGDPTWSKVNQVANNDHKAVLSGHQIRWAASANGTHVAVAKWRDDDPQFGAQRIFHWTMPSSDYNLEEWDFIQASGWTQASGIKRPHYNPATNMWHVAFGGWGSGGVLQSSDNAVTWSKTHLTSSAWGTVNINDVGFNDSATPTLIAVGECSSGGVVFASTDGGATWEERINSSCAIKSVLNVSEGVWLIGCAGGTISISMDNGYEFLQISTFKDHPNYVSANGDVVAMAKVGILEV